MKNFFAIDKYVKLEETNESSKPKKFSFNIFVLEINVNWFIISEILERKYVF